MSGRRATPHELRVSEREYALAFGQKGDQTMRHTARHTPGPWQEMNGGIASKAGEMLAQVFATEADEGKRYGCGESDANARLIAAAPDLLAALRDITSQAKEYAEMGRDFPTHGVGSIIDIARAAIRRAEGQP